MTAAVKLGVVTQSVPAQADISTFQAKIAPRTLDYAMFMMSIETDPILWSNYQAYCLATGVAPIVTQSSGVHSLSGLASGALDSSGLHSGGLVGFAQSAKTAGIPIIMRFFHEFNGSFNTTYGFGKETAAQFVAGWRHVHDIFTAQGVTNVQWVWNPNIWSPDQPSIACDPTKDDGSGSSWYPGDAYVDYIALDGYMTNLTNAVSTVHDLFSYNYGVLRKAYPSKPFAIAECGCAAQSRLSSIGGKAGWYDSLLKFVRDEVTNCAWVTQWDRHDVSNDYTIDSQGSDLAAAAEFTNVVLTPPFVAVSSSRLQVAGAAVAAGPTVILKGPCRGAVENIGATTIYVGGDDLTSSNYTTAGFAMPAGTFLEGVELERGEWLYAVSPAAQGAVTLISA